MFRHIIEFYLKLSQIDWNSIQIEERWEEEGRQEVLDEEELYAHLGLGDDDLPPTGADQEHHDDEYIVDSFTDERKIEYDKRNPVMELGSASPNMEIFRLCMRQYAINHRFELYLMKTDRRRYRAKCKGDKCMWKICA